MWTHLSRYKGGIGVRGPGEKQLEEDRRIVGKRIRDLKLKLEKVQARKEREVAGRGDAPTVSLVGYTNAGKSTLMNALTGAGVLAEDKLFATLDTRTKQMALQGRRQRHCSPTPSASSGTSPTALVASFKATLEEASQADLLLHVADASSPEVESQIRAVHEVLEELGLAEHPTILVLNKVDRLADRSFLDVLMAQHPGAVAISASKADGLERLEIAVRESLDERALDAQVETAVGNGRVLAYLAQHARIDGRTYDGDDKVLLQCRLPRRCVDFLNENGAHVRTNGSRLYA